MIASERIIQLSHVHSLRIRLQNSPCFCVFKYARTVKQKVWNEAENRERDWGETLSKTLTPRFTDFFTDFEKKNDCFAVYLRMWNSNCTPLKYFASRESSTPQPQSHTFIYLFFFHEKIKKESSLNNLTTSSLSVSSSPARKVTRER